MKEFDQLLKTVRILRSPKGCPWDRAQKVKDMKGYLLEEVYELIDGIDRNQAKTVEEELGDIFLILIVITEMFRYDNNKFDLKKVFKKINNKLISRHPHVFSSKRLNTKEEVLDHWVKAKAKKKKRKSIKDRLPQAAPSLLLANIFLKECTYLTGKKLNKNQFLKLHLKLKDKVKALKGNKASKDLLSDIIIDVSKIAFSRGINLETQTRKVILREAKKTLYDNGG
ncbi:MAG: hypothetical protein K9L86_03885 [Candidatus Omnitrophica bacterium]|nr:hypothetical protein [Candidatus Omnitrophota bacterium]